MKKFICFLSVFVLLFSCLALGVSAADYDDGSGMQNTLENKFLQGTEGTYEAEFDSFKYIKGWKYHYTVDFQFTMDNGVKCLKRYVIYTDSDIEPTRPMVLIDKNTLTATLVNNTGSGFIKQYIFINYMPLNDNELQYWTIGGSQMGSTPYYDYTSTSTEFKYVGSDLDITDPMGNVLFTKAPLVTGTPLEMIIKTSLNQETQTILTTMLILLLCGVGCLACLISLPLLKKVFYHFRVQ